MRSFFTLIVLFAISAICSFASVEQNGGPQNLLKMMSDLAAKVEAQQQRITQLESQLTQNPQSSSHDDQHNVAKRAVSMPVAFSANLLHTQITHAKGTVIRFDHVTVNDGGGYQASTGVFIAPQAGLYFFTWMFLPQPGYTGSMALYHNGVIQRYSDSVSTMAGNSAVLRLNREDQVWLATYRDEDGIHENHSEFCSFRISD